LLSYRQEIVGDTFYWRALYIKWLLSHTYAFYTRGGLHQDHLTRHLANLHLKVQWSWCNLPLMFSVSTIDTPGLGKARPACCGRIVHGIWLDALHLALCDFMTL